MNLIKFLQQQCQASLIDSNLALDIELQVATASQFGHYQCNSALKLAKILKINPKQLAADWLSAFQQIQYVPLNCPLFAKIEIAGPGFINLFLNPSFLSHHLEQLLNQDSWRLPKTKAQKIIIDYSSPNVAKEMHVGHLRSTIIGECLAQLFEFAGHEVLRLNHIGDWGTQFGMLIHYLLSATDYQNLSANRRLEISQLVQWYRLAKQKFDEDASFKTAAQQAVVALQQGKPEYLAIWRDLCEISEQAYEEIYQLLQVKIKIRGESFYNPLLPLLIKDLQRKNLLQESNGAQCLFLPGFVNRDQSPLPLIIQKSDGGYNYASTDLAALKQRVEIEQADRIIYVTDAGQSQHFAMIFQAGKLASYCPPRVQLDHVPFGLVLGLDGKKFKTRSGTTERLVDLISSAIEEAKCRLAQREHITDPNELAMAAKALGINAIKYADLATNRTQDYQFSYEKMLKFEGNTAAFLMYAYVRIQSIVRKSKQVETSARIDLTDEAEMQLAVHISQFYEVIDKVMIDLLPNRLCDYLYQLAVKFHHFFHHCQVLNHASEGSRIKLCLLVAKILETGFTIIGLKAMEKM